MLIFVGEILKSSTIATGEIDSLVKAVFQKSHIHCQFLLLMSYFFISVNLRIRKTSVDRI